MRKINIRKQLGQPYRWVLILLGVLFIFLVVAGGFALYDGRTETGRSLILFGLLFCMGSVACWLRLKDMDRHPDLVDLSRYGPLSEVMPAIEAELADAVKVKRLGVRLRLDFFGRLWPRLGFNEELGPYEVFLSPSWLIFVWSEGYRMSFFHLPSLVVAALAKKRVVLIDDRNHWLKIPGTEGGRMRLLAEILERVPWALNHFEPETEKAWADNRVQVVSHVRQRRDQMLDRVDPPIDPAETNEE